MRRRFSFCVSVLLASFFLFSSFAQADRFEYNGYFRSGTGTNLRGGPLQCVTSPGTSGNEFRYGNECGLYAELGFLVNHLEAQAPGMPYFRSKSLFSFARPNYDDAEGPVGGAPADILSIRELYAEGGNFDGTTLSFWGGKRFYRWPDVHMDDWFPVSMNGAGGGVGNIGVFGGHLEVSYLQAEDINLATPGAGPIGKSAIHARFSDIPIGSGKLDGWLTGAVSGAGQNATAGANGAAGEKYQSGHGFLASGIYKTKSDFGDTSTGFAYGDGILSNMSMGTMKYLNCDTNPNASANAACQVNVANRIRAWENVLLKMGDLQTVLAAGYDTYSRGVSNGDRVNWLTLGVSPIYNLTEHFQLAAVIGHSMVRDDSETNADGSKLGMRTLTRVTVGPQFAMIKGFYGRPVIRAFYTYSAWSNTNKAAAVGTAYASETNSQGLGVQAEAWF